MHRIVSSVLENGLMKDALLRALRNYIHYFQSFTFRLLRYDDYEDFSAFIDDILKYFRVSIKEQGHLAHL
ncbi:MAG: hypothetical protein ACK4TF_04440 [Thermodesulfovibrionales bacterium]